jgi:voltage-gated potassium channel
MQIRRLSLRRRQRFYLLLALPILMLAVGTAGYVLIERWAFGDALYMAVITLTTVGYLEVHPLGPAGRAFTMAYLLVGVYSVFWAATALIQAVVSGEVRGDIGRQRMERRLAELKDHAIVCGLGRMGHLVCAEFSAQGLPFVVVDKDAAVLDGFHMTHGITLHGDATSDEVLRRAGVERARVLVTAAASDADNLYITMSARLLSDELFIVARAEGEQAETKLLRAGASRVVSPYVIGGQRMAQAVLRPAVVDFIELATRSDHLELQIEETEVDPGSAIAGAQVRDSRLRQELGVIVVAIKKADGRMLFNPAPEERIAPHDTLIALGRRDQMDRLGVLAGPPKAH